MKKHRDYRLPKYAAERDRFDKVRLEKESLAAERRPCVSPWSVQLTRIMTCTQLARASMDEMERLQGPINASAHLATEGGAARSLEAILPPSLAVPSQAPPRSWEWLSHVGGAADGAVAGASCAADLSIPPMPPPSDYKPRHASQAMLARHSLLPSTEDSGSAAAAREHAAQPPPPPPLPPPSTPGTLMEVFTESYAKHSVSGPGSGWEVPSSAMLDVLDAGASGAPQRVPKTQVTVPDEGDARADHARLQARLRVYGMREKTVSGDGNCQFRALADQLYRDPGRHAQVRAAVIGQLRRDPEAYSVFVTEPYEAYVSRMAANGTWGDHLTLQAAADVYACRICLLTSYKDSFVVDITPRAGGDPKQTLWLSFFAEVHYNSIYNSPA